MADSLHQYFRQIGSLNNIIIIRTEITFWFPEFVVYLKGKVHFKNNDLCCVEQQQYQTSMMSNLSSGRWVLRVISRYRRITDMACVKIWNDVIQFPLNMVWSMWYAHTHFTTLVWNINWFCYMQIQVDLTVRGLPILPIGPICEVQTNHNLHF